MANPMDVISAGSLRRCFAGENVVNPIVQCVQIKPMQNAANGIERFRVVFNDTVNFIQSMIAQRKSILAARSCCRSAATTAKAYMQQKQTILCTKASSRKARYVA